MLAIVMRGTVEFLKGAVIVEPRKQHAMNPIIEIAAKLYER
jgi:hypothetical protein